MHCKCDFTRRCHLGLNLLWTSGPILLEFDWIAMLEHGQVSFSYDGIVIKYSNMGNVFWMIWDVPLKKW
jgi:hypothetical protein